MWLAINHVFAADTEVKGDENLKGEVYAFIAASLSNSMEEIQKDFNELYPNVTIYYSADSSGTLQTQIEEGARCDLSETLDSTHIRDLKLMTDKKWESFYLSRTIGASDRKSVV